tara:strand:- start:622 stop:855 length:234 start_codon:yes stop_codon:yes gene_type:complete
MYIYVYTQLKLDVQMIEIRALQKNGRVLYVAKRKKCKKSVILAASLNGYPQAPTQLPMFLLKPYNCCVHQRAKNGKK